MEGFLHKLLQKAVKSCIIFNIKETIKMDIRNYMKRENEKPLDNIVTDGGFCSILQKIVCVGDSLSSGEFEYVFNDNNRGYFDNFPYSWGQFIARDAGVEVYNFSRGGMSTKEYCEGFADSKGFWNADIKANAYIIALGVNDYNLQLTLGDLSDIDKEDCKKNKPTFTGYYAQIVSRYKKISPNAKFFFVTMPFMVNFDKEQFRKITEKLYDLANYFDNSYVLDLQKYGPDYTDKEFIDNFFLNGHLNASGYKLTAKMIESYIDYIIRNNPKDFYYIAESDENILNLIKKD